MIPTSNHSPSRAGRRSPAVAVALGALAVIFAAPAAADLVTLKSGATVHGTVLKRDHRRVWIDVGADVLEFEMESVRTIETETVAAPAGVRKDTLFHTVAGLPELHPREHAKRIGSAVIKVSTPSGLGSGVIIHADGYAITNAHVVQGERRIRATVWFPQPDGTLKRVEIDDVEIIAVNNHIDLALLKIEHPDGGSFPRAPLEAREQLEVGQVVFAIGNPMGLERTLSQGVVSTIQRSFGGLAYVQTDAAINPGNSGGPLFNMRGEVVGITNMGILGGEALGFAIPARYLKDFIRNREAFAFDKSNPNSGHNYHQPPPRTRTGVAPGMRDGGRGAAGATPGV